MRKASPQFGFELCNLSAHNLHRFIKGIDHTVAHHIRPFQGHRKRRTLCVDDHADHIAGTQINAQIHRVRRRDRRPIIDQKRRARELRFKPGG